MSGGMGQASGPGQVGWEGLAEEVFAGLREWRVQHPRATFKEIAGALDERLARLRARLLTDAALASAAREVGGVPQGQRPVCPDCGGGLVVDGAEERTLTTTHEQQIRLRRQATQCTACGRRVSPPG